ncbi:MAG: hypothetical protein CMJ17_14530 [Phenylobacterium sp.]|nr:hypothetical protein [Phenylobacterium sp.]
MVAQLVVKFTNFCLRCTSSFGDVFQTVLGLTRIHEFSTVFFIVKLSETAKTLVSHTGSALQCGAAASVSHGSRHFSTATKSRFRTVFEMTTCALHEFFHAVFCAGEFAVESVSRLTGLLSHERACLTKPSPHRIANTSHAFVESLGHSLQLLRPCLCGRHDFFCPNVANALNKTSHSLTRSRHVASTITASVKTPLRRRDSCRTCHLSCLARVLNSSCHTAYAHRHSTGEGLGINTKQWVLRLLADDVGM